MNPPHLTLSKISCLLVQVNCILDVRDSSTYINLDTGCGWICSSLLLTIVPGGLKWLKSSSFGFFFLSLLPSCCVPLLRFNKNFLTLQIPLKEGTGGERQGDSNSPELWSCQFIFWEKASKKDPYFDKNVKQLEHQKKDPERMNSSTLTHFLWQRKALRHVVKTFSRNGRAINGPTLFQAKNWRYLPGCLHALVKATHQTP
jgi:hypothetical protein